MMVGSRDKLQSETGYIDARPHPPDRRNLLQRTAGPYIGVTLGRSPTEHIESASPPESETDMPDWPLGATSRLGESRVFAATRCEVCGGFRFLEVRWRAKC